MYASMSWVSISSGNGLLPAGHQAITWINADLLSIGPYATNFIEIWIEIQTFSSMKMHLKMSSVKLWPFCPGEVSNIGFIMVLGLNESHIAPFV